MLRVGGIDDFKITIPKLIALLDHADALIKSWAARGLAHFFAASVTARPKLEKLTKSKNPHVVRSAWCALVAIGESDFSTLPLLLVELDANDQFGREWLMLLRQFDRKVWTELAKVFPTSSPQVRAVLAASLRNGPAESLPVAVLALGDSELRVRRTALQSCVWDYPPPE